MRVRSDTLVGALCLFLGLPALWSGWLIPFAALVLGVLLLALSRLTSPRVAPVSAAAGAVLLFVVWLGPSLVTKESEDFLPCDAMIQPYPGGDFVRLRCGEERSEWAVDLDPQARLALKGSVVTRVVARFRSVRRLGQQVSKGPTGLRKLDGGVLQVNANLSYPDSAWLSSHPWPKDKE